MVDMAQTEPTAKRKREHTCEVEGYVREAWRILEEFSAIKTKQKECSKKVLIIITGEKPNEIKIETCSWNSPARRWSWQEQFGLEVGTGARLP